MAITESIFREYDIRGEYPNQINEDVVKKIGFAISHKCIDLGIDEYFVEVLDSSNNITNVSFSIIEGNAFIIDLWESRPVVLNRMSHFGCPEMVETMSELQILHEQKMSRM